MPNEYCEIIKQLSEADYDSGKDSDIQPERVDFVEVCEEETQVGNSLLQLPDSDDIKMDTKTPTESDKSSDSEPEFKSKPSNGDEKLLSEALQLDRFNRKVDERAFEDFEERTDNFDSPDESTRVESKKDPDIARDGQPGDRREEKEDNNSEKDRMLSDCTDRTLKVNVKNSSKDGKSSNGEKRERIAPPLGDSVISGPLEVCLSLGSDWKRRYLTLVDDSLYVWTSHR